MAYLWKKGRHRPCEHCPYLAQSFPFFIMFMVRKLFIPSFRLLLTFSSIHSPLSLAFFLFLSCLFPSTQYCVLPFLSSFLTSILHSFRIIPSPLFFLFFLLSSFPFLPFLPFLLFFFSFLHSCLLSTLPFLRVLPSPWLFPHPLFPSSIFPFASTSMFPIPFSPRSFLYPFPFLSFPFLSFSFLSFPTSFHFISVLYLSFSSLFFFACPFFLLFFPSVFPFSLSLLSFLSPSCFLSHLLFPLFPRLFLTPFHPLVWCLYLFWYV